jgi:hypothetical protein
MRHDKTLSRLHQIGQQPILVQIPHQRARRDLDEEILTIGAVLLLASPMFTVLSGEMMLMAKVMERIQMLADDEDHVATVSTIPPSRPAIGHVLLTAERDGAVAAPPTLDVNFYAIV